MKNIKIFELILDFIMEIKTESSFKNSNKT